MSNSGSVSTGSDALPTTLIEMSKSSQSASTEPQTSTTSTPSNLQAPNLLGTLNAPQDPFLPRWVPQGPVFLDTNACLCALQPAPDNTTSQVWECLGNATSNPYLSTSGKWFSAANSGVNVSTALSDASNPPITEAPLVNTNNTTLVPLSSANSNILSAFDLACTGVNRTNFTTSYYRATDELARSEPPIDAASCFRPGAVPIPITGASSWQNETGFFGCREGFFCPNNTINSLPQYCYPLEPCVKARLAGSPCHTKLTPTSPDINLGMGLFEPVVCTAGFYCPQNATQQIECPAGSYCPPGSARAIKCSAGSNCPAGSQNEAILIPFSILIIVDVLLIVALLYLKYRKRQGMVAKGLTILPKHKPTYLLRRSFLPAPRAIKMSSGYEKLDEPDAELIPLESTVKALKRVPTGFQAALDEAYLEDSNAKGAINVDSSVELRQFVDSMRKAINGSSFGLSFGFEELSFQPKGVKKPILSRISGSVSSGSLVGVMGGSGAGKSTFVNVLMGKTTNTSGAIKVNGVATKMKRYKKIIGYVPQDDIVLPELTVRENILHSARIRLPSKWTEREVQDHVDAVIDCLDLTHVRESRVGSVAAPIISGGQRKRVSIGIELSAAPMAIFLDEPTSGLDATAASSIMKTLKALSALGMTIVVIIHQPRVEIFEMIDDLILLGNGRLIFQGLESEARPYFVSLGFHFPDHCNAGDIITDIITGNGRPYKRHGDVTKDALIEHWESTLPSRSPQPSVYEPKSDSTSLHSSIRSRGAPLWRQYYFCLTRAMRQQHRALSSFWFEMGVAAFGGFLIGLAQNGQKGNNFQGFFLDEYEILSSAIDYKSVPMMALLVCISIGLIAAAPGVRVFGEENLVFRREASSGHGRLAYYLAKTTSTAPRMVLGCFHFTTFFMLLATPRIPWLAAFLANLLYFYCIYGLASVISIIVRQSDGPLFAVMASLIVGVLSGAAPPLAKVEKWHVSWLWRSSPGVWLAEIYFGQNVSPLRYLYDIEGASRASGFKLDGFWEDVAALVVIGAVYRVLAFGGLIFSARVKR